MFNNLDLLFFLLNILFLFYIVVMYLTNEYKKSSFLYSFSIVTIFYTPIIYFYFGGESYRFFSDKALEEFTIFSVFIFSFYMIITLLVNFIKMKTIILYINDKILIRIYFFIIAGVVFTYYLIFFKDMPLVHLILYSELIKRPDLTGSIPFFYSISSFVVIIIPSIYMFYFKDIERSYIHIISNILIVFFLTAAGHKGDVVFYFIFIWIFILNFKINFKIILLFFISMLIYLVQKGIFILNMDTLEYLMSSPFRRFFVTQGTGHIIRFDMILEGYNYLEANPRGIKFDVFAKMYNTDIVGSAPTFFTGDIFVKYGAYTAIVIFILVSSILKIIANVLYKINTNKKLFFYWNIYIITLILSVAEISFPSFLRISLATFNILIIVFLSKINLKGKING